jgi:hypothetical protein
LERGFGGVFECACRRTVARDGVGGFAGSGEQRDRSQSRERVREVFAPGPASGQVQRRATGAAGDPSWQGQVAAADRLGDDGPARAKAEVGDPAGEVVRERADQQPGGVGGETAGGGMVET